MAELERRPGHEVEPAHEKPEDWGWHHEWGGLARGAGWVSAAVLLLLNIGNHTRHWEDVWLTGLAVLLILILLVDRHRRKNSWRS